MTSTALLFALLVLMSLGVAVFVVRPLWQAPSQTDADRDAAETAATARSVLRERRRELDAALSHLPTDSPQRSAALAEFAAQAQLELAAQGSALAPSSVGTASAAPRSALGSALAVTLGLLIPSMGLYLLTGTPQAVSPSALQAEQPASLDALINELKRKLAANPDDAQGWVLLGRTELSRGDPAAARQAFERALPLSPRDAQIKADLADAIAQSQGNRLEGRPIELLREALANDPRHPKALALAGAYEVSRDNLEAALVHWRALLQVLPSDSPQSAQIAGYVADLQAGRRPGADQPRAAAPPQTAAASEHALRGTVTVAPALAARVEPSSTLFVVARRLDDQGQPTGAPLAVLRGTAAQLPLTFTLDDQQAMSPMAKLSGVPAGTRVMVVARLSRSGEAAAKSGDLLGRSRPVQPGARDLQVLIDTVSD